MIENLTVENYRSFRNFSINGLKRVNLFTGYNNSGKTSLLEAVQFLSSDGDPWVLFDIATRRGELIAAEPAARPYRTDELVDISHFFCGHYLSLESGFSVHWKEANSPRSVHVAIHDNSEGSLSLFENGEEEDTQFLVSIEQFGSMTELPITSGGGLRALDVRRVRRGSLQQNLSPRIQLVGADSLSSSEMALLWDRVLVDRVEDDVYRALRVLDGDIDDVVFLNDVRSVRSGRQGILIGCKGQSRRMPLGSYGEGTPRLLALAMSLVSAKGRVFLVDEIDTGLHHTVLADMWKLVIETAVKNDIQVFATTHSYDCLKALSDACRVSPEFSEDISVQSIDRRLGEAVSFGADNLHIAIDQGIEVR